MVTWSCLSRAVCRLTCHWPIFTWVCLCRTLCRLTWPWPMVTLTWQSVYRYVVSPQPDVGLSVGWHDLDLWWPYPDNLYVFSLHGQMQGCLQVDMTLTFGDMTLTYGGLTLTICVCCLSTARCRAICRLTWPWPLLTWPGHGDLTLKICVCCLSTARCRAVCRLTWPWPSVTWPWHGDLTLTVCVCCLSTARCRAVCRLTWPWPMATLPWQSVYVVSPRPDAGPSVGWRSGCPCWPFPDWPAVRPPPRDCSGRRDEGPCIRRPSSHPRSSVWVSWTGGSSLHCRK